jgi:MFS family permease
VSAVALLMFLLFFKKPSLKVREVNTSGFLEVSKIGMPIWLVGVAWMWFNAAFISFLTFAQDFFVLRGYEVASASLLSSIIMVGAVFLSPLTGYITSRFGKEEVFIIIGGISLTALIFSISETLPFIPILLLMGIFVTFVSVPIFSLPSKIVRPEHLGLAFGILTTCANVGVLVGPYLVGLVKDLTNEYTASFYLMSLFTTLLVFTILILYLKRRKSILFKT